MQPSDSRSDASMDLTSNGSSPEDDNISLDPSPEDTSSAQDEASASSASSVSDEEEILKIIESAIARLESLLVDADNHPSLKEVVEELKRIDMAATRNKRKVSGEGRQRKRSRTSSEPKDVNAEIAKHIKLTMEFVAPSIEVDDAMSVFDYAKVLKSDNGFAKSMKILDSNNERLFFGRTCVFATHPDDVPDKYRSMKGRVTKVLDIDEALLLVFYKFPTLLINFNDSKMEKFANWYKSAGNLYIKKFSASVGEFLDAFYAEKREEGKKILDMWKQGNYQ